MSFLIDIIDDEIVIWSDDDLLWKELSPIDFSNNGASKVICFNDLHQMNNNVSKVICFSDEQSSKIL